MVGSNDLRAAAERPCSKKEISIILLKFKNSVFLPEINVSADFPLFAARKQGRQSPASAVEVIQK